MRRTLLHIAFLCFLASPPLVQAEEVRLLCTGVHSGTKRVEAGEHRNNDGSIDTEFVEVPYQTEIAREIRFNEDTKEFWYRGSGSVGGKKDQDGWVAAKKVVFSESKIMAEFSSSGRKLFGEIMSLGIARIGQGKPVGTLDRYSGIWRLLSHQLNCRKVNTAHRKF